MNGVEYLVVWDFEANASFKNHVSFDSIFPPSDLASRAETNWKSTEGSSVAIVYDKRKKQSTVKKNTNIYKMFCFPLDLNEFEAFLERSTKILKTFSLEG